MSTQMICPHCGGRDNRVMQTREHEAYNWVLRRRSCNLCDNRWNTIEIIEDELQLELED